MAINGLNGSYLTDFLAQSLSSPSMISPIPGGSSISSNSIYGNSLTTVSISAFGSQINDVYNKLKGIEDPTMRENALGGMRQILTGMVTNPSDSQAQSFISTIGFAGDQDVDAFAAVFSGMTSYTVGGDESEPTPLTPSLSTYAEVSASPLGDGFSSAALGIITDPYATSDQKQLGFDAVASGAKSILDSGLSEDQQLAVGEAFFSGLAEQESIEDKIAYVEEFDIYGTLEELGEEAVVAESAAADESDASSFSYDAAAYDNVMASSLSGLFESEALAIVTDSSAESDARNDAYNQLLGMTDAILNSGLSESELAAVATSFYDGIMARDTVDEKVDFMSSFEIAPVE